MQTQACDGLTTALCPELGIVGFGKTPELAMREVFDATITNSKVILKVKKVGDGFRSVKERTLFELAPDILSREGNIQSLFNYTQL